MKIIVALKVIHNQFAEKGCSPVVIVLPNGAFVLTTYGHWIEADPPFVVSVRLKLEELCKGGNGKDNA